MEKEFKSMRDQVAKSKDLFETTKFDLEVEPGVSIEVYVNTPKSV